MKTRQKIANEIRDLVTQVNARVAELEEEGYSVGFCSKGLIDSRGNFFPNTLEGLISEVKITKQIKL